MSDDDDMRQQDRPHRTILEDLTEGNRRFVQNDPRLAETGPDVRSNLARGQSPAVAVLACSDSRVAPELIFDQGLGRLFVVRVAGNVVDDTVLGSLEYAVAHLGVAAILVLGHSGCGAVTSACTCVIDEVGAATGAVLRAIGPAVEAARAACPPPDELVDAGARVNVAVQAEKILASSIIREAVATGELAIHGAWYDLSTGWISWL